MKVGLQSLGAGGVHETISFVDMCHWFLRRGVRLHNDDAVVRAKDIHSSPAIMD